MGDNSRTVNTSTTPHNSDQLGTENMSNTVILIYRHDMSFGLRWYVSIWTSFWIILQQFNDLETISIAWVNTENLFLLEYNDMK